MTVHNHDLDPTCPESIVNGQLRGTCMGDRLSESIARLEAPTYLDPVRDELDRLRTENAAYRAGADDTDPPENARRTARQAWHTLLNLPAEDRMQRLDALLDDAYACDRFAARLAQAEARVDQLTDTLTLRSDALNRTGASNDQLRATIAAISRIVGALEETVELDCDPVDGGCHDLDLTDDGRCSLVADLNRVRAIIRGDAK